MKRIISFYVAVATIAALSSVATIAYATHSWGPYHWGRTANPFTVKLGDNVSTAWDAYLAESSSDWSVSSVLDTTVVPGGAINPKRCRPTSGRVEVCNASYGFNGWLGVASIWINSSNHITQGTVKLNDSYFNTSTYNTPPWRRLVTCQEVGHTFGLHHQDENFSNPNLGTCMDYTSDPDGPPSNEHPNAHDYEQLGIIYSHLDSSTTVGQAVLRGSNFSGTDAGDVDKTMSYIRDLGNGEKLMNFIFWTE